MKMDRIDFLEVLESALLYFDNLSYAAIKSNGLNDENIRKGIKIAVKLKEQSKSQEERLI